MALSMRPVKEVWHPATACFVGPQDVVALLFAIAGRVDTRCENYDYADKTIVYLNNGSKVVNYIETDPDFTAESVLSDMVEHGSNVNMADLELLIGNMRSLAASWRNAIGKQGELIFYVDVY
jgi:hypothetical protein